MVKAGAKTAKPNVCVRCVHASGRAIGRVCSSFARLCTRQTWRFIVRWYSFLVILGLAAICAVGLEKAAVLSSGCCTHSATPECCEVEALLPVNVTYAGGSASLCIDAVAPTTSLQACMGDAGSPALESCLAPSGHSLPTGFSLTRCLRDRTAFEGCMCAVGLLFAVLLLLSECLATPKGKRRVAAAAVQQQQQQQQQQPAAPDGDASEPGAQAGGNGAEAEADADAKAEAAEAGGEGEEAAPTEAGDEEEGGSAATPLVEDDICLNCRQCACIGRAHARCVGACADRFFFLFGFTRFLLGRAVVFFLCGTLLMFVAASHSAHGLRGNAGWFLVFLEGALCVGIAVAGLLDRAWLVCCELPRRRLGAALDAGAARIKGERSASDADAGGGSGAAGGAAARRAAEEGGAPDDGEQYDATNPVYQAGKGDTAGATVAEPVQEAAATANELAATKQKVDV
jgi:hypothetical protein